MLRLVGSALSTVDGAGDNGKLFDIQDHIPYRNDTSFPILWLSSSWQICARRGRGEARDSATKFNNSRIVILPTVVDYRNNSSDKSDYFYLIVKKYQLSRTKSDVSAV